MVRALPLAAVALLIALGSAQVQQDGPDIAFYCEIGPPEELTNRPGPRLNGGWPAPFLFDAMSVSVVRQLSVEDDFRPAPFVATWSFHLLWLLGLAALARRVGR